MNDAIAGAVRMLLPIVLVGGLAVIAVGAIRDRYGDGAAALAAIPAAAVIIGVVMTAVG